MLSEEKQITLGLYQLKHAPLYATAHLDQENAYHMYVCKVEENLLNVKLQQYAHTSFVEYDLDGQITGLY